jgi:hypothetical protein
MGRLRHLLKEKKVQWTKWCSGFTWDHHIQSLIKYILTKSPRLATSAPLKSIITERAQLLYQSLYYMAATPGNPVKFSTVSTKNNYS